MSYRRLALAPFALLAVSIAAFLLAPAGAQDLVLQLEVDASKLLGLAGLTAAALAFDRGDYLRRGWGLAAGNYVFLLARDATLPLGGHVSALLYEATRGVVVTAGNVLLVLGSWTLARAWSVAGLEHPGSKGARRAILAAAILAALLFAGPTMLVDLKGFASGTSMRFDMLGSDLGDLLALPIVAPVALTALAVQGGTLRWPWSLLAASLLSWLLYDALYTVPDYFPVVAAPWRLASEQFHVFASLLACAAGLAQRRAVTEDDGEPGAVT
ncbi:MAG TPA: hypothetical protein VIF09_10795 [Polyangiaceae bacterium]